MIETKSTNVAIYCFTFESSDGEQKNGKRIVYACVCVHFAALFLLTISSVVNSSTRTTPKSIKKC